MNKKTLRYILSIPLFILLFYSIINYLPVRIIAGLVFIFFFIASLRFDSVLVSIGYGLLGIFICVTYSTVFIADFLMHPFNTSKFFFWSLIYLIARIIYIIGNIVYYIFFSWLRDFWIPIVWLIFSIYEFHILKGLLIGIPVAAILLLLLPLITPLHRSESKAYLFLIKFNKPIMIIYNKMKRAWLLIHGADLSNIHFVNPELYYQSIYAKIIAKEGSEESSFDQKYTRNKVYLDILGLDHFPTKEELVSRRRELAKKLHPDSNTGDPILFHEMDSAYKMILKEF